MHIRLLFSSIFSWRINQCACGFEFQFYCRYILIYFGGFCGIGLGATTDNLPPGVLYRVRATYKYTAEDDDELALEVGDIVQVIEYEDPEEQVLVCDICISRQTQSYFFKDGRNFWLDLLLPFVCLCLAGGGLADGHQGEHGAQGTVPSQLHPTDLNERAATPQQEQQQQEEEPVEEEQEAKEAKDENPIIDPQQMTDATHVDGEDMSSMNETTDDGQPQK